MLSVINKTDLDQLTGQTKQKTLKKKPTSTFPSRVDPDEGGVDDGRRDPEQSESAGSMLGEEEKCNFTVETPSCHSFGLNQLIN